MEDLNLSRDKMSEDYKESQAETDAKFSVLVKELQTVKSQIYYLQQSVLHLRGAVNHDESTIAPLPSAAVLHSTSSSRSLSEPPMLRNKIICVFNI